MKFDLNLLSCFQVVAERRSVSAASTLLHLSQPAISLQIKRLETQLGKKLFDRESHGLRLTPFGEGLLAYAKKISDVGNEIERFAQAKNKGPAGVLRIGTYTTVSSYLISRPVSEFLDQWKDVSLSYEYETVETLLNRVKNRQIEGAVLSDVPENPSLQQRLLFTDELVFAVAKGGKFKINDAISAKDLSKIPFLSYPLRYDYCYRKVETLFGKYLARGYVRLESTSFDSLKSSLLLGVGAAFMPRYLISDEIQNGKVRAIKIGNHKLPIRLSFVSLKEDSISVTTKAFRDHLIRHFGRKL